MLAGSPTTGYGATTAEGSPGGGGGSSNEHEGCMSRFVKSYIGVLFYLRYPILLTWGFLVFMCALAGANLTNSLKQEVAPPHNSPATAANQAYGRYFPNGTNTTGFLSFIDSTPYRPFDVAGSHQVRVLDAMIQFWLATNSLDFPTLDPLVLGQLAKTQKTTKLSSYSCLRELENVTFPAIDVEDYLGAGNFSILAAILLDQEPLSSASQDLYRDFVSHTPFFLAKANLTNRVTVSLIGLISYLDEINTSSGRDVVVMFGIVVPIALIIFCASLDSLRLGILALCSLVSTLLGTFAVLDGVARSTDISSVTPGIVGAMCIALSSDFTYMLASKFRREVVLESAHFFDDPSGVTRGVVFVDPKHVMVMVVGCAGRVVFISGISVAFASLGLVFFPLTTFSSIGIGCLVSAFMAMLISLVLTPTLLVTFYRFFATGAEACEWPTFGTTGGGASQHGGSSDAGSYSRVGSSSGADSMNQPILGAGANTTGNTTDNTAANANVAPASKQKQQQQQQQKSNAPPSFVGSPQVSAGNSACCLDKTNNNNNAAAGAASSGQQQQQNAASSADNSNPNLASSSGTAGATTGGGGIGGMTIGSASASPTMDNTMSHNSKFNVQLSRDAVSRAQLQLRDKRVFYRDFTAFLSQPRIAIICILCVTAVCLYPMTRAFDGKFSNSMNQFMPRDAALMGPSNSLSRQFEPGVVFPYKILIEFNSTALPQPLAPILPRMCVQDVFTIGQDIVARVKSVPGTYAGGIDAIFYDGHFAGTTKENVTWAEMVGCLNKANTNKDEPWKIEPKECIYRAAIWAIRVPQNQLGTATATEVNIVLRFEPTSEEGRIWIQNMRAQLSEIEKSYNKDYSGGRFFMRLYLQGFGADAYDLVEYSEDHLTMIVAILISTAWFMVTAFFFSLGASLRLLVSLVFTLLTCFGLATIIFVDGALATWPVPEGLTGKEKAEGWLVPFAAIALNIATVLNYDIIATIRVQQFRHQGIATRSAIIIAAIEASNEVFIAAIMTIVSFSGLLFSQVPVMNQLGFFFICGAFLQGIVFRVFLVVPVMSLLGEYNWFPYMQIAQSLEKTGSSHGSFGGFESGGVGAAGTGDGSRQQSEGAVSILAPPAATSSIVDNEVVMWAARESGLDARRFSSLGAGAGGGRGSYVYSQNTSFAAPPGSSASRAAPLEFVFSSNSRNPSLANNQNPTNSSAAHHHHHPRHGATSGGGSGAAETSASGLSQQAGRTRGSHARTSLLPEDRKASDSSSLKNFGQ